MMCRTTIQREMVYPTVTVCPVVHTPLGDTGYPVLKALEESRLIKIEYSYKEDNRFDHLGAPIERTFNASN